MIQFVYSALVRLHPPAFRRRFGGEMLSIFDRTPPANRLASIGDAVVSLSRQWLLRSEFRASQDSAPPRVAGAAFLLSCGEPRLSPNCWLAGGAVSLLCFVATFLWMTRAGDLKEEISSVTASEDRVSPLRFPIAYFHAIAPLDAIDANHDLVISSEEIANASAVLRSLDANGDGALDAVECGGAAVWPSAGARFMSYHPVLAALDADHDGVISDREIRNAPAALRSLDKDRDGRLTASELLPEPRMGRKSARP